MKKVSQLSYILYFVLFIPNFGVLFDRTGVCTSIALCLHTSKRLQWFLESDTVLFIIGFRVQTSREGFMALKWPWHTGGTSK